MSSSGRRFPPTNKEPSTDSGWDYSTKWFSSSPVLGLDRLVRLRVRRQGQVGRLVRPQRNNGRADSAVFPRRLGPDQLAVRPMIVAEAMEVLRTIYGGSSRCQERTTTKPPMHVGCGT